MRRATLGSFVWIALTACTGADLDADPPQPHPVAAVEVPPPPLPAAAAADPDASDDADTDALVLSRPVSSSECAPAAQLLEESADAMRTDQPDVARNKWLQLIREFPTCPEVPHVYIGLAEHFFAKGELANAKQTFEKAAQFDEPEVRAYALYKLAWCELGLREGQRALEHFVQVVRGAGPNPSPAVARLRDTAIRDSVIAYADVAKPTKAVAFYRALLGDAPLIPTIDALARTYRDRGDEAAMKAVCESAGAGACVGL